MNRFLRAGVFGFCICGLSGLVRAGTTPDPQHPPAEAFGNLPVISQPSLSPDGAHLAMIQPYHGRPAVVIYPVPAQPGKHPAVVDSSEWTVISIRWVKNDRLILIVKDNNHEIDNHLRTWDRAMSVDADGKDAHMMMAKDPDLNFNPAGAMIQDIALSNPTKIYMSLFVTDREVINSAAVNAIVSVDVRTGIDITLLLGRGDTQQWLMDGHGSVVARVDYKPIAQTDWLYLYNGRESHQVATFAASGDSSSGLLGLSDDGKSLVRDRTDKDGMYILAQRDPESGTEKPLFALPDYDVHSALYDEWTGRVIGASYAGDKMEYRYFDPKREGLQRGLEAAFPGTSVVAVSSDLAGDKAIVGVDSPSATPRYFLLDRVSHAAAGLPDTYPELKGVTLGEMKSYNYKARDGLAIPAYLTLPPGKPAKNLPLVVMPHGGPDDRDRLGFDWWAQFLVNRGYAVLQPEYRGSKGYGRKFTEAGFKQWGLKMQDDITDGVKKTIADGIADPKRICIVGASYGGYAALAGGAFTPDLYACVVSFAGVSDLPVVLRSDRKEGGDQGLSFWAMRIGSSDDNWDQLTATSPARHADQFRAPVLLMHGEGDTTVRIDQSEVMNDALKDAGKNVTFIRFPGADHYLELADTRIRVLQETEKFLDKYIGH